MEYQDNNLNQMSIMSLLFSILLSNIMFMSYVQNKLNRCDMNYASVNLHNHERFFFYILLILCILFLLVLFRFFSEK